MKKKYKLIKADKLLIKLIKYLSKAEKKQKGVKIIMATETPKILSVTVELDGKEVKQYFVSKEDYESLLTKISELSSTIAKQYAQIEDFKTKFEADKKELEGELKSTVSKLDSTNEELKAKISEAQEFKGKFERASQDLLNTKENLDKKENELKDTKQKATNMINRLKDDLGNKESEINSLNDNIQAKESEISSKNSEISSLKSLISNLENDISRLNEEYCSSLYEDFLALPEDIKNEFAKGSKKGINILMLVGRTDKLNYLYEVIKDRLLNSKGLVDDGSSKLISFYTRVLKLQSQIDPNLEVFDENSKNSSECLGVNDGGSEVDSVLLVGYSLGSKNNKTLVIKK